MSPVERIVAHVLAKHALTWDDGGDWAACSCGHESPQTLEPDWLDDAHRAHVAAEVAAALRADDGLVEAMAKALIRVDGWKDEPVTQTDRRLARAALDDITTDTTGGDA